MKFLQVLLLLLGVLFCSTSVSGYFYEQYFEQTLVPIDRFDRRTWPNRYYVDDSYYTPGGPMFLTTAARDSIKTDDWLNHTYFFDMGREMNGLLVHTEHRFFADNRPTPDVSMANLQFMDTRYAVDDVAKIVEYVSNEYQTGAVIAHGFDHGAAISVWLAHRHPDLVQGLWASSATILAEKDNSQYLTNVAEDIRIIGGESCYSHVETAFDQMENLYSSGNYQPLEEAFNLCSSFTPGDEREAFNFFYSHILALGSIIRYSHRLGVEYMCENLDNYEDKMVALAEFISIILPDCVYINDSSMMEQIQNVYWNNTLVENGIRQMGYQNCREVGWYHITSENGDHPFGNRLTMEVFYQQCLDLFGPIFTPSNMRTFYDQHNQIFGGNRPNVRNAYFTVGEYDPYKYLGVLESYRDTIYVDIIQDMGAGAEVLSFGVYPVPEVQAAQTRARQLITQWINQTTKK